MASWPKVAKVMSSIMEVGSNDIGGKFNTLLSALMEGQRVVITSQCRPVAELVKLDEDAKPSLDEIQQVIQELRELRKGNVLGEDIQIRELIEDGRRY